jgi:hypothetical protein
VSQPTFSPASILADTIVRTVELGVTITGAAVNGETTVVWCELVGRGPQRCPGCGSVGTYRDSVERRLTDLPVAGHPLQLRVRVPRYRCPRSGCERVIFSQDTALLARAPGGGNVLCHRRVADGEQAEHDRGDHVAGGCVGPVAKPHRDRHVAHHGEDRGGGGDGHEEHAD